MTFAIRPAEESDFEAITAIYARARTFMAEHGNPRQWNTTWPPDFVVEDDIKLGRSYVCVTEEENAVVAAFVFLPGPDATYADIFEGNWLDDSPYSVVHRIAVSGTVKGAASFCLQWAFQQSGHLRIDTHPDNIPMQRLLAKNGFTQCGIIYVEEDDDPRFAYEK